MRQIRIDNVRVCLYIQSESSQQLENMHTDTCNLPSFGKSEIWHDGNRERRRSPHTYRHIQCEQARAVSEVQVPCELIVAKKQAGNG